mmetsp:Transcript_26648/g.29877  ORF Transcript_26648/g.29877 Transcript_26648/m.29877 type:complete len:206 (-) Transcript_26648:1040-1657(-)
MIFLLYWITVVPLFYLQRMSPMSSFFRKHCRRYRVKRDTIIIIIIMVIFTIIIVIMIIIIVVRRHDILKVVGRELYSIVITMLILGMSIEMLMMIGIMMMLIIVLIVTISNNSSISLHFFMPRLLLLKRRLAFLPHPFLLLLDMWIVYTRLVDEPYNLNCISIISIIIVTTVSLIITYNSIVKKIIVVVIKVCIKSHYRMVQTVI